MRMFIALVSGVALLTAGAVAAGVLLPATRAGSAEATFAATPDRILDVMRDVARQPEWRRNVRSVEMLEDGAWVETTTRGERLTFSWIPDAQADLALRFASPSGYDGVWRAYFLPSAAGTHVRIEERVGLDGAINRIVSYIVFDPGQFSRAYLEDLETRLRSEG